MRRLEGALKLFLGDSAGELEDNYYSLRTAWIEPRGSEKILIVRLSHRDLGEVGRKFPIPNTNTLAEIDAWLNDILIWITEIQESPTRSVDTVPRDQAGVYWPDDDIA